MEMQQFSARSVLPPRHRSLLPQLSCLPFIYAITSQASPCLSTLLAGCSPHLPTLRGPSPPQGPTALQHRLCQQPISRTCSQDGRRAAWVCKCYYRHSPFSSVRASRPPCHTAGLAEGLLLTADTFGVPVNNKTKAYVQLYRPCCTLQGSQQSRMTDSGRLVLHSTYRVLAGNTSFPLTTNPSGNGKKGNLLPRETKSCHCQNRSYLVLCR